ncbi:MAG: hypothetical protein WBX22_07445 [Silvibacterium sp.]
MSAKAILADLPETGGDHDAPPFELSGMNLFHCIEGRHEAVKTPKIYLRRHLIRGVHGQKWNAYVEGLHVAHGKETSNGTSATDFDFGSLGLPRDVVLVENPENTCGEFGVRVEASTVTLDSDTVANDRSVGFACNWGAELGSESAKLRSQMVLLTRNLLAAILKAILARFAETGRSSSSARVRFCSALNEIAERSGRDSYRNAGASSCV